MSTWWSQEVGNQEQEFIQTHDTIHSVRAIRQF